jgi:ATP-dependent protease ClpP protease subunit
MSPRSDYRNKVTDLVASLRERAVARAPQAAAQTRSGLTVANADDGAAVLRIYDEISYWGVSALDVIDELSRITASNIRVEINSPGGDVFDGIAIHNALRAHSAHVTVRVDGLAASIASVIAQAGDHRVMLPAAQMMIHNAWGLVIGDHDDHSDMAQLLEQQDTVIAGIYAARSGRDLDEFRTLMDAETWLTDQATVDLGLADEVAQFDPPKPAATSTTPIVTPAPAPVSAGMPPVDELKIAANANRRRR